MILCSSGMWLMQLVAYKSPRYMGVAGSMRISRPGSARGMRTEWGGSQGHLEQMQTNPRKSCRELSSIRRPISLAKLPFLAMLALGMPLLVQGGLIPWVQSQMLEGLRFVVAHVAFGTLRS